jgi:quercetin dioxygenase-like cupin family protein
MSTDPQVVWMPGDTRTEIHLVTEDTDGRFCMLVDHPPPDWSLPAHLHSNESETIHIVAGEFEMEVDGERMVVSVGETVHVPRGVIHSGRNIGEQTGTRVLLFSPSGMECFFMEAGAAAPDDTVDRAATAAAAMRHGWAFVQPQG